jgi:murein DD-endopeptidase MepM/ murein hydrolase activator NlpD
MGGYNMGSYNSQYENYYRTMVNKRSSYGYGGHRSQPFRLDGNFFLKRFMRELIGVLVLFLFVIGCKLIVTPQTEAAYKYSKEVLNKQFDYKSAISTVKELDLQVYEDKALNWMDSMKSKLTGGKTLRDRLKDDFILPVEGEITSTFGTDDKEGIAIEVKAGTEVLSVYEGTARDLGEDIELGKYIVIDHGNGIETKYAQLNEISVAKDALVKKGQVIGKAGSTSDTKASHLYFELIYMGDNKNPEDYLSFAKN